MFMSESAKQIRPFHWDAVWALILAEFGGHTGLAKHFGISRQAIHKWNRQQYVPVSRVWAIEQRTGISVETLCPDILGAPR